MGDNKGKGGLREKKKRGKKEKRQNNTKEVGYKKGWTENKPLFKTAQDGGVCEQCQTGENKVSDRDESRRKTKTTIVRYSEQVSNSRGMSLVWTDLSD